MALLKEKHPNQDFFAVDFADVVPKDDTASMEHPLFSLATKPDMRHLRYENGDTTLEITPSADGLPTIFDKDVLIFCISLLMHRKNAGQPVNQRIRFSAREFSIATNRPIGGNHYRRIEAAFKRLMGMTFTTNMPFGSGKRHTRLFHLVDEASFVSVNKDSRLEYCEVKLSDWTMEAIEADALVSISRDYFRLRRPLERRLYELARKHCGGQNRWQIGLAKLQNKTGSNAPLKRFRLNLRQIIKDDDTPFYTFELDDNDLVTVRPRKAAIDTNVPLRLKLDTEEKAREIARSKGLDYHMAEMDWREFAQGQIAKGKPPKSPDGSFIGWLKKRPSAR